MAVPPAVTANDSSPFLLAAHGLPARHTPVWFMRQAGRSLPEYRALRGEGSILDAIKRPDLAAEFTLQPVRRYGVDAAVLYSDIVVSSHAVGFGIDVAPGTGPVAERPLRTKADLSRLRPLDAETDMGYVLDTIDLLVDELEVPLLGFAGAPFTVASYLIEGRPSRTYEKTFAMMRNEPVLWGDVMERLTQHAVELVDKQIRHGAGAFQIFDSWIGALDVATYRAAVLPHTRALFTELRRLHSDVAGIHFGVGCSHLLEEMHKAGAAVLGVDQTVRLDEVRRRVGGDVVLQGNLDPAAVLAGRAAA
ncbi:MAG: uroporphyrinogen decarboxylase, partial [Ilumatobacteraceae bacterium]|nr:uroporphyrinogen decarboxylase [Ilumatobacteraceae bacterium]